MDKMAVRRALEQVLVSARGGFAEYAKTYAEEGIRQIDAGLSDEMIRVQLLYVLNNLGHWKGDEAKKTKAVLKEASKRGKR